MKLHELSPNEGAVKAILSAGRVAGNSPTTFSDFRLESH